MKSYLLEVAFKSLTIPCLPVALMFLDADAQMTLQECSIQDLCDCLLTYVFVRLLMICKECDCHALKGMYMYTIRGSLKK